MANFYRESNHKLAIPWILMAQPALQAIFINLSKLAFSTLLINIFMVRCSIDFYIEHHSIKTKYNISFGVCQGQFNVPPEPIVNFYKRYYHKNNHPTAITSLQEVL